MQIEDYREDFIEYSVKNRETQRTRRGKQNIQKQGQIENKKSKIEYKETGTNREKEEENRIYRNREIENKKRKTEYIETGT